MGTQERAFRLYYASMTDAELLHTAANRKSFVAMAQRVLDDEMGRRQLSLPLPNAPPVHHSALWNWSHHLAERLHVSHHPAG
jgi:hypothetical protein